MRRNIRTLCVLAGLVLVAIPSIAQMRIGQNTLIDLSGQVGTSYNGSSGSNIPSSHGTGISGDAYLQGSYFDPRFLSFGFAPYYNRDQSSSTSISIGTSSGYTAYASFFSGSRFPGTFALGQSFNGTGQFAIPGSAALLTQGSGRTMNLGWSVLIPNLPNLSVNYTQDSSSAHVVGVPGTDHSKDHSLNLSSNYDLAGFRLNGSFTHITTSSDSPAILDQTTVHSQGVANNFQLSAGRLLPHHSNLNLNYVHSSLSDQFQSGGENFNTHDSSNALLANYVLPISGKVSTSFSADYNDNLTESVEQQIISAGGLPLNSGFGKLRNLTFSGSGSWSPYAGLGISAGAVRTEQFFLGQSYTNTQFFGNMNYGYYKPFLGSFLFSFNMQDTATQAGNNGVGFTSAVGYNRKVKGFDFSGNVGYSQNTATLVSFITTSGYSYGGSIQHLILHGSHWFASYGASHSGFSVGGSTSESQVIVSGLSRRRFSLSGNYSKVHSLTFPGVSGVTSVPSSIPGILLGTNTFVNDSKTYGVSGAYNLRPNMLLTASYNNAESQFVQGVGAGTDLRTRYLQMNLQYFLRKLSFGATYIRFSQGQLNNGTMIPSTSVYSFGVRRWFNWF